MVIFDLDGTIFDVSHRLKYLNGEGNDKWDKFYRACEGDETYPKILDIVNKSLEGKEVRFWTARPERYRELTEDQLLAHTNVTLEYLRYPNILKMRKDRDWSKDFKIKGKWVDQLTYLERRRLECIYDDRKPIIEVYISKGVEGKLVEGGEVLPVS